MIGQQRVVRHLPRVGAQSDAGIARHDVKMYVEHGLARLGAIELHQRESVRLERGADRNGDLLRDLNQAAEIAGRQIEQVLGRGLRCAGALSEVKSSDEL